ncbi:MAG TPA: SMI1/KNR4 family protein [Stenomitos sp.]
MNSFNWESFLRQWSRELLESITDNLEKLPSEVIESKWLGYPGATEKQIARAEARLGMALPPSYREFLKVTNGWRQTTPFIYRLWSTEDIEWFSVRHQDWINAFVERYGNSSLNLDLSGNGRLVTPSIPDADYLIYGDEQDCSKLRVEYLHKVLEISDIGESTVYLLNPQVMTEDGEWEAWFFGDWLPGADRYRSFQDMMLAEYENFLELRENSSQPVEKSTDIQTTENGQSLPDTQCSNQPFTVYHTKGASTVEKAEGVLPLIAPSSEKGVSLHSVKESTDITAEEHHSTPVGNKQWSSLASFTVEFQVKQLHSGAEQRAIVCHIETDTVKIIGSTLESKQLCQWMLEQLNPAMRSLDTGDSSSR